MLKFYPGEFLRDVADLNAIGKPFELIENESFETVRGRNCGTIFQHVTLVPGSLVRYLALNTSVMSEVEIDSARRKSMAIPDRIANYVGMTPTWRQKRLSFSGSQKNRILTLFYAYLFFPGGGRGE